MNSPGWTAGRKLDWRWLCPSLEGSSDSVETKARNGTTSDKTSTKTQLRNCMNRVALLVNSPSWTTGREPNWRRLFPSMEGSWYSAIEWKKKSHYVWVSPKTRKVQNMTRHWKIVNLPLFPRNSPGRTARHELDWPTLCPPTEGVLNSVGIQKRERNRNKSKGRFIKRNAKHRQQTQQKRISFTSNFERTPTYKFG